MIPVLASLRSLRNIVAHSRPFWNSVKSIGFPLTISGRSLAHPSAIALLRSFDQQRKIFFGGSIFGTSRRRKLSTGATAGNFSPEFAANVRQVLYHADNAAGFHSHIPCATQPQDSP